MDSIIIHVLMWRLLNYLCSTIQKLLENNVSAQQPSSAMSPQVEMLCFFKCEVQESSQ